jgi:hypothetical protein
MIGLFAAGVLMCFGLASTPAKAAPPIPELNQQSLIQEAGWRRDQARRWY